jgi:hypothetical protein
MKRLMLEAVGTGYVMADIAEAESGAAFGIFPSFNTWYELEARLLKLGASRAEIKAVKTALDKRGSAFIDIA